MRTAVVVSFLAIAAYLGFELIAATTPLRTAAHELTLILTR